MVKPLFASWTSCGNSALIRLSLRGVSNARSTVHASWFTHIGYTDRVSLRRLLNSSDNA